MIDKYTIKKFTKYGGSNSVMILADSWILAEIICDEHWEPLRVSYPNKYPDGVKISIDDAWFLYKIFHKLIHNLVDEDDDDIT